MEVSCLTGPCNPYWNNCKLHLATNEITAIFKLCPLMPIGSLTPTNQAIHEYTNGANSMRSHITTMIMNTESVSKMSDFINLLTWLSARENFIQGWQINFYRLPQHGIRCASSTQNTVWDMLPTVAETLVSVSTQKQSTSERNSLVIKISLVSSLSKQSDLIW
jgi:hypothetical protein